MACRFAGPLNTFSTAAQAQPQTVAQPQSAPAFEKYGHVIDDAAIDHNGGLLEYSVVYTDRALNHMSEPFQRVMTDLHASLCKAYNADSAVILPGSGTYAMEGAARAFGSAGRVLIVRNGYFSYRWSQIFATLGRSESDITVLRARPTSDSDDTLYPRYAPPPIDEVVATILKEKPSFVAAPHVETSAGMILPDEYVKKVGEAAKEVGAIFCLDGVASGTAWIDANALGVDCYITAPQKGWSGPACCGVAVLSERAVEKLSDTVPSSFTVDLAKWHQVMHAYLKGGHMYHATMPTEGIRVFRDVVFETEDFGLAEAHRACFDLGKGVRNVLADRGFASVAAPGFEAPGVAVVHAPDASFAAKFKSVHLQIAAGVPLMIGEPDSYQSFRIGLFGLDKLKNVHLTVDNFAAALDKVIALDGSSSSSTA